MTTLSDEQLAAYLRKAGVDAGNAAYLVAIAHPESDADPQAVQKGQPYATTGWGLWQITPGNSEPNIAVNKGLLSAQANADAAAAKLHAQGLGAWTTYTSGAYQPYFAAAKRAVAKVYGFSMAQVDALTHSTSGTGAATGQPHQQGQATLTAAQGSSLLGSAGSLFHGLAVVLDRFFALFAPGQGWRIVFGAAAVLLALMSYRSFTVGVL